MGTLYEAVADYLRAAGEPRTAREIAEALQAGGYPTAAVNFPATVRTMLLRRDASHYWGIRKTRTGHRWFIEEPAPVNNDSE